MYHVEQDKLSIDKDTEFWKEQKFSEIVSTQKTTTWWIIDYFIKGLAYGDQGIYIHKSIFVLIIDNEILKVNNKF